MVKSPESEIDEIVGIKFEEGEALLHEAIREGVLSPEAVKPPSPELRAEVLNRIHTRRFFAREVVWPLVNGEEMDAEGLRQRIERYQSENTTASFSVGELHEAATLSFLFARDKWEDKPREFRAVVVGKKLVEELLE